nr:zinc finger, CCHC-type [Tanacetum cinerariifolium]GEX85874.1 zinc finger, CCHC-type [Tanacetum cinerariifolium]
MRLRLFQFSLRDQASNWLERLPAGSITTWEDLTTQFLAQFFPPGRTLKLRNYILMFQQHHEESLSEAWTRFKDLLQKVHHQGINLWLQVQIFYDHVNPITRRTINQSAGGKLRDRNAKESCALLEDLALYDNESHLAPTQPTQVNKFTTSCEICSGPHNTQYCMEDPKQAFVEYVSLRTDEAGVKNPKLSTTLVLSARSYPTVDPQCSSHPSNSINAIKTPDYSRLGDSKPFNTLADLGSCVNIIPLYLLKKLNIRPLEETNHVFRLADGTKSYTVGIVKDVEVHIGKLKLLNNFYVIDIKKDPETPLLVGKGFLATANTVIDCRMSKIAVGEGITRSVFGVKGVDLGEEEAPYWITLRKKESYKPRPRSNGIGTRTPYYARKDFLDCHLPKE